MRVLERKKSTDRLRYIQSNRTNKEKSKESKEIQTKYVEIRKTNRQR